MKREYPGIQGMHSLIDLSHSCLMICYYCLIHHSNERWSKWFGWLVMQQRGGIEWCRICWQQWWRAIFLQPYIFLIYFSARGEAKMRTKITAKNTYILVRKLTLRGLRNGICLVRVSWEWRRKGGSGRKKNIAKRRNHPKINASATNLISTINLILSHAHDMPPNTIWSINGLHSTLGKKGNQTRMTKKMTLLHVTQRERRPSWTVGWAHTFKPCVDVTLMRMILIMLLRWQHILNTLHQICPLPCFQEQFSPVKTPQTV